MLSALHYLDAARSVDSKREIEIRDAVIHCACVNIRDKAATVAPPLHSAACDSKRLYTIDLTCRDSDRKPDIVSSRRQSQRIETARHLNGRIINLGLVYAAMQCL